MTDLPDDFVPENSDVMSAEEEYELLQVLETVDANTLDDFVDVSRPRRRERPGESGGVSPA